MVRSLMMWGEANPDKEEAVVKAIVAHLTAEAKLLKTDPVIKWAQVRASATAGAKRDSGTETKLARQRRQKSRQPPLLASRLSFTPSYDSTGQRRASVTAAPLLRPDPLADVCRAHDISSPSILKHLLKVEGGAAE